MVAPPWFRPRFRPLCSGYGYVYGQCGVSNACDYDYGYRAVVVLLLIMVLLVGCCNYFFALPLLLSRETPPLIMPSAIDPGPACPDREISENVIKHAAFNSAFVADRFETM